MYYLVLLQKPNHFQSLYMGASPFDAVQVVSVNLGATIDIVENELSALKIFDKKNNEFLKAQGIEIGAELEISRDDFLKDLQALKDAGLETVGNIASFGLSQLESLDETLDLKQGVSSFLENIKKGGSDALDKANDLKMIGSNVIGEVFLKIGNFLKKS